MLLISLINHPHFKPQTLFKPKHILYNSNTHGELKSVRVTESNYRGNLTEGTEKSMFYSRRFTPWSTVNVCLQKVLPKAFALWGLKVYVFSLTLFITLDAIIQCFYLTYTEVFVDSTKWRMDEICRMFWNSQLKFIRPLISIWGVTSETERKTKTGLTR